MRDPLISFLRARLPILTVHHPLRLLLASESYPYGFANRWGTPFGVTVCAACEPSWTEVQRRAEWGGYGEGRLRAIPRWVE